MEKQGFIMRRSITTFLALLLVVAAAGLHGPVYGQGTVGVIDDPVSVPGIDKPVRVIRGRFTSSISLTNQYHYVLRGVVIIDRGATINIQAGTRIVGEFATLGTLLIGQGGRINAVGTPDAPIVFTSDQPIGQRNRGDWGGLIINGEAPLNVPGGIAIGEGGTGQYGGNNPADNSGTLRYVRVEFAGIEFSPDNELNGIAFQGTGSGTVVDHVQVSFNKDDGIEMFGGTTDLRHIVLSSIGDDSLDWTFGWTGRVQYLIVHQRGDDADNGWEADNNGSNNDLLPRSSPTIYNVTLVGDPDSTEGGESDDGMLIREGTAGTIRNFIVIGFKEYGVNIDQTATVTQLNNGTLSFANGIIYNNGLIAGRANLDPMAQPLASNSSILIGGSNDPGLVDPYNHTAPNYQPASNSSLAMTHQAAVQPNDGFFEIALYLGAMAPGQDWTAGWTSFARP
jgi:hypothetical protein